MLPLLVQACPSFGPQWEAFISEWKDEPQEQPLYLALSDFAKHLILKLESSDIEYFPAVFALIERLHLEGDPYVKEAATVGLLEDLQNGNLHKKTNPSQFEQFLLPESKRWWSKVNEFWKSGKIIADD